MRLCQPYIVTPGLALSSHGGIGFTSLKEVFLSSSKNGWTLFRSWLQEAPGTILLDILPPSPILREHLGLKWGFLTQIGAIGSQVWFITRFIHHFKPLPEVFGPLNNFPSLATFFPAMGEFGAPIGRIYFAIQTSAPPLKERNFSKCNPSQRDFSQTLTRVCPRCLTTVWR